MYSRGIVCQYGSGFPVYRGIPRQYGNGLGSIFKAAMRTVIPILKPLAKAGIQSAKQVAKTHGVGALRDIMAGQNVKQVLKHRGKDALSSLGRSTLNELKKSSINSGGNHSRHHSSAIRHSVQKGRGRKRKHKKHPTGIPKKYLKFEKDIFD